MNDKIIYLVLFLNSILSAFSQVLLKKSAIKKYNCLLFQYLNLYVVSGYFIFFVVLVINILTMKCLSVSVVSVFSEVVPLVISLFFGFLFFNEKIGKNKIFATIMIVAGVLLIIV